MALRNYVLNNFWWKLASLFLAILTWITISEVHGNFHIGKIMQAEPRVFHRHSITVLRAASDVRSYRVIPSEVDVTVNGDRDALNRLTDKEVDVYINLTELQDAVSLQQRIQVNVPPGLAIVDVTPQVVRIERIQP